MSIMRKCCRAANIYKFQIASTTRHAASYHTTSKRVAYQSIRSFTSSTQHTPAEPVEEQEFALPRAFLVTTPDLPGYEIEQVIGVVAGNTVRVRNAITDRFAAFRSVFGGELTTYSDLMAEARAEALARMVQEAVNLGANAVVNIRLESTNIAYNASELLAFGTAIRVKNYTSSTKDADDIDTTCIT